MVADGSQAMRLGRIACSHRQTLPATSRKTTSSGRRRKNVWMARHGRINKPSFSLRHRPIPWTPRKRDQKLSATYNHRGLAEPVPSEQESRNIAARHSIQHVHKLHRDGERDDQKGTWKYAENKRKHQLHRGLQCELLCHEKAL